jgi:hypothetical protein
MYVRRFDLITWECQKIIASPHTHAHSHTFCNTGAIAIAPLPIKGWGQKPGSASLPFFGIQPVLLSQDGKVRVGCMRMGVSVCG